MRAFGQELASAWRRLRQAPGFVALATITLGLGIGASTAVFSVIDPLILRSLPVRDPGRLVLLHSAGTLQTIDVSEMQAFERYSADRETLEGVLADASIRSVETSYRGQPETANAVVVSANYFDVLGVAPYRGRLFTRNDGMAGGQVVVLSHAYWVTVFGADSSVVGQTIVVQGTPREIVGVTPRAFLGLIVGVTPDFYLPLQRDPQGWVRIVGRLRQGVSIERARVALEPTFRQIVAASELPAVEIPQAMSRLLVTPAGRGISESRDRLGSRPWALMLVVLLALLVASANVAGLVLTRAAGRRREIAVALALGATRGRLAARFLAEGGILTLIGAAVGLTIAHWGSRALVAWLAVGPAPLTLVVSLDARVATFTIATLAITVLACGALPAWSAARADVMHGLRLRSAGLERGARLSGLRRALVVLQIAASVTLLAGAGLVVRSLINLHALDVGYDADRVLAVSIRDRNTTRPVGQAYQLTSDIALRLGALPAVAGAAFGGVVPLSGGEIGINVAPESRPSAAPVHALLSPAVTRGYFEALGIRLVQGEGCPSITPASAPTVVLNARLAGLLFGRDRVVGERVRFVEGRRPPMTVVGVSADATYTNVREEPGNFLYVCWVTSQTRSLFNIALFVRSATGSAGDLAGAVRSIVQSIDPALEIRRAQTLEQYRADALEPDRLVSTLFTGFAGLAAVIAGVGLFGVLSATVARQVPEIGLRMALGADTVHIVRFVATPAILLTGAGLILGVAGASLTASLLSSLIFGLRPADPITWGAVALALAAVTSAASAAPVRRAVKIDPAAALRTE